MLSSVLNSKQAVYMNILIMRAFVRLREILTSHKDLARAIEDMSRRQDEQGEQITAIIETINQLLLPEPVPPKRQIGVNCDCRKLGLRVNEEKRRAFALDVLSILTLMRTGEVSDLFESMAF